ncbi:FliH/SctL family protein [Acinetobacter oleivorans]|uniref:FliH/SctL family protein n=1 Tax=Acinetobacter oleivorans TaxID=1148157 RepID=UPI00301AE87C
MNDSGISARLQKVIKSDRKVTLGTMIEKVITPKEILKVAEIKNVVPTKKEQVEDLVEKELSILKRQYADEYKKVVELEKARLKDIHEKKMLLLESQFKAKIDSLTSCIVEFTKKNEVLNSSLELIAIKTIDEILKKMTIDLTEHEGFIAEIIKKALVEYNLGEGFTLKVNVHEYELIKKIISENIFLVNYNIVVEKDNSLKSGQYSIDLKESMLDIGVKQQFDKVRQLLND